MELKKKKQSQESFTKLTIINSNLKSTKCKMIKLIKKIKSLKKSKKK
jgi:hypothetical protein